MPILFSLPMTLPHSEAASYAPAVSVWGPLTFDADHRGEGLDLLIQQFRDKPRVRALLYGYLRQVQEVEDAAWAVLLSTSLDLAANAQLDGLGLLVGEPRRGRTDTEYRAAIRVRILINTSDSTHADMLAILTTYLGVASGAGTVRLAEPSPAALALDVFVLPASATDLRVLARTIKPAGVSLDARVATTASPLILGWSGGAIAGTTGTANGLGWSGNASTPGGTLSLRI